MLFVALKEYIVNVIDKSIGLVMSGIDRACVLPRAAARSGLAHVTRLSATWKTNNSTPNRLARTEPCSPARCTAPCSRGTRASSGEHRAGMFFPRLAR